MLDVRARTPPASVDYVSADEGILTGHIRRICITLCRNFRISFNSLTFVSRITTPLELYGLISNQRTCSYLSIELLLM